MKYKFEALPCKADAGGYVVRQYAIDDEVICEISMDKFLSGNEDDIQSEIEMLLKKIEEKTGVLLTHDELGKALHDRCIDVNPQN